MIDLTEKLKERFKPYPKDPKRISVSGVYAMMNGWDDNPPDFEAMMRMWKGTWKHKQVQELLPEYQHEIKKEYPFKGWVLVGKADCLADDHILEIKTSDDLKDKAKEWEVWQAKMYCSMYERPFCYIVQPVFTGKALYLKRLRRVGRNDEWFQDLLAKIDQKINDKV